MRLFSTAVLGLSFLTALITPAFAANVPADFDEAKWEQLVQKMVNEGEPHDVGDGFELRALSRLVPNDTEVPHTAEYISSFGLYDIFGNYVALEIWAVSEKWAIDADGNWDITQRTWRLTGQGELYQLSHSRIVETRNRMVLKIESLPQGRADSPEELEIWGKKLAEWF